MLFLLATSRKSSNTGKYHLLKKVIPSTFQVTFYLYFTFFLTFYLYSTFFLTFYLYLLFSYFLCAVLQ